MNGATAEDTDVLLTVGIYHGIATLSLHIERIGRKHKYGSPAQSYAHIGLQLERAREITAHIEGERAASFGTQKVNGPLYGRSVEGHPIGLDAERDGLVLPDRGLVFLGHDLEGHRQEQHKKTDK